MVQGFIVAVHGGKIRGSKKGEGNVLYFSFQKKDNERMMP